MTERFALGPGLGAAVGIMLGAVLTLPAGPARAADAAHPQITRQHWSFGGLLGHYDDAQL